MNRRRFPFGQSMLQIKWRLLEFDIGVHLVGMYRRRQLSILDLQYDLRQSGDSRRRLRMPDIRFDGTDRAELFFRRLLLKRLGQRGNFDAVAQLSACAMTFDIANGFRMNMRLLERMAD